MRVKIEEVDGLQESGTTGRIVEVEEGDAVETCFICNRPGVYGKSDEYEGEVVRYCCQEHQDLHQGTDSVLLKYFICTCIRCHICARLKINSSSSR